MDSMILLVAMIAVFYFLIIRPENKRKKQAEDMRNSLKKGERITTIGGMVGRIVQVNDTTVVFETSEDRVRIEVAKWGIQSTDSMEAAAAQKGKKSSFVKKDEKKEEEPAKVEENSIRKPPLAYAHVGECRGGFLCGADDIDAVVCEKVCMGRACVLRGRICAAGADGCAGAEWCARRRADRRGGIDSIGSGGIDGVCGGKQTDEQALAGDARVRSVRMAYGAAAWISCWRRA